MKEVSIIGLDIAKHVFQAHGASASGDSVFRKKLSRANVLAFFSSQPACMVALEACGGAHYWARELEKQGHTVRLIPPAYVKPFVKRHKNDAVDAEAICEAAQRPNMRFVAVKSEEQQASAVVFRFHNVHHAYATRADTLTGFIRSCGTRLAALKSGIHAGRTHT